MKETQTSESMEIKGWMKTDKVGINPTSPETKATLLFAISLISQQVAKDRAQPRISNRDLGGSWAVPRRILLQVPKLRSTDQWLRPVEQSWAPTSQSLSRVERRSANHGPLLCERHYVTRRPSLQSPPLLQSPAILVLVFAFVFVFEAVHLLLAANRGKSISFP